MSIEDMLAEVLDLARAQEPAPVLEQLERVNKALIQDRTDMYMRCKALERDKETAQDKYNALAQDLELVRGSLMEARDRIRVLEQDLDLVRARGQICTTPT